tara:strand:- start:26 stop:349 length:324 start_codon:yes stop_codon:yes gene_type:complete
MEGNAESAFKEVKEMFNNAFSWLKNMMTSVKYKLGRSENNTIKKQVNNIQKSIQIIRSVMANAEANATPEVGGGSSSKKKSSKKKSSKKKKSRKRTKKRKKRSKGKK